MNIESIPAFPHDYGHAVTFSKREKGDWLLNEGFLSHPRKMCLFLLFYNEGMTMFALTVALSCAF
ncbi:MAG: hypothetical protein VB032_05295 [Burkholderiaceae bacterium]|nr:hypothetical protein [Burkholderiaceae bacterium]